MPKISAQADLFRDWDAVLGACAQNASLLPGIDPFKTEVEAFLAQVKDLKIQQETMEGQRRGITQRMKKAIEDGRESVRKVRAFAMIRMGSDNQALSQFGVAVRVRRPRKSKAPATPPPAVSTAGAPQPTPAEPAQAKEGAHA